MRILSLLTSVAAFAVLAAYPASAQPTGARLFLAAQQNCNGQIVNGQCVENGQNGRGQQGGRGQGGQQQGQQGGQQQGGRGQAGQQGQAGNNGQQGGQQQGQQGGRGQGGQQQGGRGQGGQQQGQTGNNNQGGGQQGGQQQGQQGGRGQGGNNNQGGRGQFGNNNNNNQGGGQNNRRDNDGRDNGRREFGRNDNRREEDRRIFGRNADNDAFNRRFYGRYGNDPDNFEIARDRFRAEQHWREGYAHDWVFADDPFYRDCRTNANVGDTIVGGLAGGFFGNAVSGGRADATAAGIILGAEAGANMSRNLDCEDRFFAYRAYYQGFETGRPGSRFAWTNDRTGRRGNILITDYFRDRDDYRCAHYVETFVIRGGRDLVRRGTSCRQEDGAWVFID